MLEKETSIGAGLLADGPRNDPPRVHENAGDRLASWETPGKFPSRAEG